VPSLYLYTSHNGPFSRLTNGLCLVWGALLVVVVANVMEYPRPAVWGSLFFPVYYFALSWGITVQRWRSNRRRAVRAPHRLPPLAAESQGRNFD
jgi:hypothetical protein